MLHKFRDWKVDKKTEVLILGTFHPDIDNGADFFYGRGRNHLWRILPICLDEQDLKKSAKQEKINFMRRYKIDFIDLIREVNDVPGVKETEYNKDSFIDNEVIEYINGEAIINFLPQLRAIIFTRKTLKDIRNIENKIKGLIDTCNSKKISFYFFETPARFCNEKKINRWKIQLNEIFPS